jgi:VWFA-related protein
MTRKPVVISFLLFILAGPLLAQEPVIGSAPATPEARTDPIKLKFSINLVHVLMTVTNEKNQLVTDLTHDDFHVFEGDKLQRIVYFSPKALREKAFRIGVIVDASSGIRNRLRIEQEAAADFLNITLRPGKDMAFDEALQLVRDYAPNAKKLSQAIRSLRAGCVPRLFDTIYYSCKGKCFSFLLLSPISCTS